ncbi:pdx1 [Symbiodinium natans]|uniref:Pdx1 protein n=1 Tax=Symbiodinium natans TaxID=878477 RepID=A0A812UW32_9DINO|nr:pdx1 [Symbiodinium natans]
MFLQGVELLQAYAPNRVYGLLVHFYGWPAGATRRRIPRIRRRLPKVPRIAWTRQILPGKPVRLPRYSDTALRLTAISVQRRGSLAGPPQGRKAREDFAELQLIRKASKGAEDLPARQRFALWRSRPGRSHLQLQPLRALLNCSDWNTYLNAVGFPLLVLGSLEGALTPLHQVEAPGSTTVDDQTGIVRPSDLDEFYEAVEAHLRQHGRTPLRRLGMLVALPPGRNLKLKKLLMERRDKFILDLYGGVEINHSRRWRWSSQGMVTKRRRATAMTALPHSPL